MSEIVGEDIRADQFDEPECTHQSDMDVWIDDSLYCGDCGACIGVTCPLCGGEEFMEEAEMEGDWVNFDDDLVTCRECGGKGWTSDPSFQ